MQALFLACIPIASALMAGCLSDVKILDATSRGVVLTGSNEARVQLEFAQPDLDLVKFASVFGLTVCYDEQRRAFLPNATPDYF
jgi:hypothetical protein